MEFEAYDDLDSMFEAIRERSRAADLGVQPWQAAVKPGDRFVRDSKLGFLIYGQILQEEEPREPHLSHYRLCRAYSIACPRGELGDIHVSTIDSLISREEFEEARQRSWSDE